MRSNRRALRLEGVFIALLLSVTVVGAVRAHSELDTSSQDTRAGEDLQQPAHPTMNPAERAALAFPGFRPGGESTGYFPGRLMSLNFDEWPPMLRIGDSTEVAGKIFTVNEVLLVPGSDRSMTYEPATGRKRFSPEGLRTNLLDFSKNTEVFIPPNSTLVMVNIEAVPEAQMHPTKAVCLTDNERDYSNLFRISYPELGETPVVLTSEDENFGRFSSPTHYCISTGWNYFLLNSLEVTPYEVWIEIVDEELNHDLAVWTLVSEP